jgi:hypothetical protein
MMGDRQVDQGALFYQFSLERHVPADHRLRSIDRFVDLEGVRAHVAPWLRSSPSTKRVIHEPPHTAMSGA